MELDYAGGKGKCKKGKDKGGSVKTCYYCIKPGHLAKDRWQNPKRKGKSNQGSCKGDHRGKGSKGAKAQRQAKGQNKSGKNHAMEGDEPEGEQFAEGEEWAESDPRRLSCSLKQLMKSQVSRWETGSRAAQKLQKDFEAGKLWKGPQNMWRLPWKLVCQESLHKGSFLWISRLLEKSVS